MIPSVESLPVSTLRERAVVIENTLIVSDLHLGRTSYDELQIPTPEYDEILSRMQDLLHDIRPETVVFAGDVFQQFDHPPDEAIETLEKLRQMIVEDFGAELVITPGNHDTYKFDINSIFDGRIEEEYQIPNTSVTVYHGHTKPQTSSELFIVGHLHPALEHRGSRWPCFLYGQNVYDGADILVLPAFSEVIRGVPVRSYTPPVNLSIPIVENGDWLSEYYPIVYDTATEETRIFPKVGKIDQ